MLYKHTGCNSWVYSIYSYTIPSLTYACLLSQLTSTLHDAINRNPKNIPTYHMPELCSYSPPCAPTYPTYYAKVTSAANPNDPTVHNCHKISKQVPIPASGAEKGSTHI